MKSIGRTVRAAGATALLFLMAAALPAQQAQDQTSFAVTGRYTAQRKPRITVMEFANTNSAAQRESYGASVQAMLVTFLKRKSQFVVVERQKLGDVLQEWQRNQRGMTNLQPTDQGARELLEKLDAIILGNVTLLDVQAEANAAQKPDQEPSPSPDQHQEGSVKRAKQKISGQKIEIDVKLLSRADGRIIAAAQRSGPVACLRPIVERLGISLEQEFLRPYYGKLKINLTDPENVRIFLKPILMDSALDEEKPPTERGSTVLMGGEQDIVEPWTTDPTSYTIENLLSGWYSMRLERPGYEGLGNEGARWEARDSFGQVQVFDRVAEVALTEVVPDLRRFVVHVDPLQTNVIDGDHLGFTFRKKGGSLEPRIKRQYLDADYTQKPKRVILIGKAGLEINIYQTPHEYAEDQTCELFDERAPRITDYGRTYVASGQPFDFTSFKGGELIFDDYKGEVLPAGQYDMTLWEPSYESLDTPVNVRDRDEKKTTRSGLVRDTQPLALTTTGARPPSKVILTGKETKQHVELLLDFEKDKVHNGLPVDVYLASTDIPGFGGWTKSVELPSKNTSPPIYDPESKSKRPLKSSSEGSAEALTPLLNVKTRLCLGGRLQALATPPDPVSDNVYIDGQVREILDILLQRKRDEEENHRGPGFLDTALAITGEVALQIAARPEVQEKLNRQGAAPLAALAARAAAQMQQSPGQPVPPQTPAPAEVKKDEKPELPKPEPLPRDPEALRALLAQHLEALDLLILDHRDMRHLHQAPEVAAVIKRFVDSGGALFAFATDEGDYGAVVGASLRLAVNDKETNRFEIASGEIPGLKMELREKKVQVKEKRPLPELEDFGHTGGWRVVAYSKGHKDPRIVERGSRDQGGYVAIWCDDPESFRGRRGGMVPDVEAARAKVERRVLSWARYLMLRRYDKAGEERRRAETTLFP